MRAPVIGITTYGADERRRYTLPAEYVAAVQRAGGLPLLIPPGSEQPERYLDLVDGVILAGGGDLDPALYGGDRHETVYNLDAARDRLELALAREIVRRQQPALAICRGMQVLNVAFGGTLVTHLPDTVGEQVLHRAPPREPVPHPVKLDPRSRLAQLAGGGDLDTISWHHQAVKTLAPGFRPVAHAADGTVEAVELAAHPWLIAVQWHPELSAETDPRQQRLFETLLADASQRKKA